MREINEFIVHCSATPNARPVSVDTIRQWHIARGWKDIGYHYVIQPSGLVEDGRSLELTGAHCKGHNANSVGVCMIGTNKFTIEQWNALRFLYGQLSKKHHIDAKPHNFYANKICPGFDHDTLYHWITYAKLFKIVNNLLDVDKQVLDTTGKDMVD